MLIIRGQTPKPNTAVCGHARPKSNSLNELVHAGHYLLSLIK